MSAHPAPVAGIPGTRILVGDVRRGLATLPARSVHCIVTSPPYYGLRDYGLPPSVWDGDEDCGHEWGDNHTKTAGAFCVKCGAWRGCLGLEPTADLYLAHLVAVFRECWRALRDDGTFWLNIGDSYAGSGRGPTGKHGIGQHERRQSFHSPGASGGMRAKSLMLIPERLLLALSDDGWIVRDKVVWHKVSAMPESVRDRCTDAWEPLYQFTKRGRYYADMEAVRQRPADYNRKGGTAPWTADGIHTNGVGSRSLHQMSEGGANLRNVWSLSPEPFTEAHFATFPTELPRRCIQISTSERGVCPTCGQPWVRVTERTPMVMARSDRRERMAEYGRTQPSGTMTQPASSMTLGWRADCKCPPRDPVPAIVLDPFGGALTTALVANQMGRDSISVELNPEYVSIGRRRIQADAGMLCDIHVIEVDP